VLTTAWAAISCPPASRTAATRPRRVTIRSTEAPQRTRAPSRSARATSAAASDPMPPRATGHPWLCPRTWRSSPKAPLPAVDGASPECCAEPASHAVARSSPSKRSRPRASIEPSIRRAHSAPSGRSAAARRARPRTGGSVERTAPASVAARGTSCVMAAHQPAPDGPSEATVAPTSRCSTMAVPSSNGWAITTGGSIHATPSRPSSSSCMAGEAAAMGATAAWSSWANPAACAATTTSPRRASARARGRRPRVPRRRGGSRRPVPHGRRPRREPASPWRQR